MNYQNAPNVRYVDIQYGDTLQRIALRELGTAGKWAELIILNKLRPPYIAETASAGVLAYGDQLAIPAPGSSISAKTDPESVYGVDVAVTNKRLTVDGGDLAVVSGVKNLTQALSHHVVVDKKELAFHPKYGCHVRSLLGRMNGPSAGMLAAFYVKSALIEDSRVDSVLSCVATVVGDQISVDASVLPVSGKRVELKLVL